MSALPQNERIGEAMTEKIELTPLGIAHRAIKDAQHDIEEEWTKWSDEVGGPGGYDDIILEPDNESLGFVVVFIFGECSPEESLIIVNRLAPVLRKHGIARVECRNLIGDSSDVPEGDSD